jgi:pimeloyl-ACP methyl ester carboxylesterase
MLGCQQLGSGEIKVIVLNDWICDTSSWDAAQPYLDRTRFTWLLTDLRGYGRSKASAGRYTVEEAAADVVALADALDWKRFAIVGHSMSTLVALHLAQQLPDRIDRALLLAPVPTTGLGVDDATLAYLQSMATGSDAQRLEGLRATWGDRLCEQWIQFKAERWKAVATPEASAAYAKMFARDGLPNPAAPVVCPVLAITGEKDAPPMRAEAVTDFLEPICAQLIVTPLVDCGHYPMQEAPPLLVTTVQRFLSR